MTIFVCSRCLGAGALVNFDGRGGYACPSCAPPHLRRAAIALDVINTVRALEAIDAAVALAEESEGS